MKNCQSKTKKEIVPQTTNSYQSEMMTSDNFNAYKDLFNRGRHMALMIIPKRYIRLIIRPEHRISYFD